MKKYIYLVTLIFCASFIHAQNIPFDKKVFKNRKEEYKIAKEQLDKGIELYNLYSSDFLDISSTAYKSRIITYRKALSYFFKANKFNPQNAQLNYFMGRCYLMNSVYKEDCVNHFLKALELDPDISPDIQYHLGIGYHISMKFDKAIEAFKKHKSKITSTNPIEHEDLIKRIKECELAKKMIKNPKRVFIDNIEKPINGKYPEYGVIISADESVMMFTSRRNTSTGAEEQLAGKKDYFEDIYISNKVDGKWEVPTNIGTQINTENDDATTAVSPDGQKMIIYRGTKKGSGDLFECKLNGSEWSEPMRMSSKINTRYHESSASYSSDGQTLYFVSNKPGGFGNHDIYVTHWNNITYSWSEAENLGKVINTRYDEEGVFFHPDGKTLYFSSRGHQTMGNYDVFKSTLKDDGTWGVPENMGYPINTVDDDVFFVINGSGRRGYYSSFKDEGHGEKDIYMITFLGPEKPFQLSSEDNLLANVAQPMKEKVIEKKVDALTKNITILNGFISDCKSLSAVKATIELVDVDNDKTLATFTSNQQSGKYLVSLPSGKNYGLIVKKEGYLFHSENFNIPITAAYQKISKNICLKKIEVGNYIVLNNIFYDYGKSTLRDASKNELNRLMKLLKENPTVKIEVSAHTDSRGTNSYNQKLSQKRAQSCTDYLINLGISANRLITKGYGETKLIKTDKEITQLNFEEDKEAAHQRNRRTEIKVIAK